MKLIAPPKKAIIYGLIVAFLAIAAYQILSPPKVSAYEVVQQDYVPSLLVSGEVIAEGNTVLSSLKSGLVIECPVSAGTEVKKGELLIKLDDAQAQAAKEQAAAAVKLAALKLQEASGVTYPKTRADSVRADLALEQAEQELQRMTVLAEAGAVSQVELEQAQRNFALNQELAQAARATMESLQAGGSVVAILQAELEQRQLELDEKEILLQQFKIVAPADGCLLKLYLRPGEMVSAGDEVALFAAGDGLRIQIQPDQRYAAIAVLGHRAQVWLGSSAGTKWEAEVVYVEPKGNAEQGSFTAELGFLNQPPPLYPGQLLSVQLFAPLQEGAILLPDSYLAMEGGQKGAWLAVDGRAHFTLLQTGLRTEAGVVITEGLKAGDTVLEPLDLKENMRLSPQRGTVL